MSDNSIGSNVIVKLLKPLGGLARLGLRQKEEVRQLNFKLQIGGIILLLVHGDRLIELRNRRILFGATSSFLVRRRGILLLNRHDDIQNLKKKKY